MREEREHSSLGKEENSLEERMREVRGREEMRGERWVMKG